MSNLRPVWNQFAITWEKLPNGLTSDWSDSFVSVQLPEIWVKLVWGDFSNRSYVNRNKDLYGDRSEVVPVSCNHPISVYLAVQKYCWLIFLVVPVRSWLVPSNMKMIYLWSRTKLVWFCFSSGCSKWHQSFSTVSEVSVPSWDIWRTNPCHHSKTPVIQHPKG